MLVCSLALTIALHRRRHNELPDRRGDQRGRRGDHRRQPQQLQPLGVLAGRRPHLGLRVKGIDFNPFPAGKPHMSVNDIVQELLGGGLIMLLF